MTGAIFISTLANEVIHKAHREDDHQVQMLAGAIQPIVAFMVLVSITVHGLSIPGFSLGRRVHSVSRTWSRHATAPDWTNQARLVDRGDDIVINRDSVMEEGDMSHNEKSILEPTRRPQSRSGSRTPGVTPEDGGSLETKMEEPSPKDDLKETPPDGSEVIAEWQEPHHQIIERRTGPGEEVCF